MADYNATDHIRVGMGAEAIVELIRAIDIEALTAQLREETHTLQGAKQVKASKRLRVVEGLKKAGIDPSWMILPSFPLFLRI